MLIIKPGIIINIIRRRHDD